MDQENSTQTNFNQTHFNQKISLLKEIDFYLVTDSGLSKKGTLSDVKEAVEAGCKIIQYREKNKSTKEMVNEASEIKRICGERAIFLVNDRIDVALAVDADGVHIGQDDMQIETARKLLGADKIIGLTVHNVEEAIEAEKSSADYLGLGSIFDTSTKKDAGKGIGPARIREVKNAIKIPVAAIGGINKENCKIVVENGADSLVAISAVVCSDDVKRETEYFIDIIQKMKNRSV
ncbi:thiamine-phosphate synthase [Methanosarcina sp. 2.H.T.1A.6]|uniref:thiamine phosphate synthase n=1 Tax=unclassified Methanosarcina TaxID=2644672 RepID=UPI000621C7D9|nr:MULTISPECIES: thiamine phosphate synthase [unclassified Methanosarcina]KKG18167.1 thiamine-phosphate synthase [Methanosarcina sp. 2.H.T.1A.3]KKG19074.1 thiamine-phosphate synthase [Methanosarcina sp. 2.H.T.1A.15]KKG19390.1 thiamine-phosphate synthase [Methanosarcina sp. 2.H.T.1A.6]KKG25568.1 thiamine-phosphate synthase [Methanosarcina sp. 2.H.T.1A.8]